MTWGWRLGPGSATPNPNLKPHLGWVYCNAAALDRATEEHGSRTVQHKAKLVRVRGWVVVGLSVRVRSGHGEVEVSVRVRDRVG